MRDAPLDRMFSRHAIDPVEYQALQSLKLHWHCSGMPGAIRSADLNRVFAADLSAMSHMAASEGAGASSPAMAQGRGNPIATGAHRCRARRRAASRRWNSPATPWARSRSRRRQPPRPSCCAMGYRLATLWGCTDVDNSIACSIALDRLNPLRKSGIIPNHALMTPRPRTWSGADCVGASVHKFAATRKR